MAHGQQMMERRQTGRLLTLGIRFFLAAALVASQTPGGGAPFALGWVAAAGPGAAGGAALAGAAAGAALYCLSYITALWSGDPLDPRSLTVFGLCMKWTVFSLFSAPLIFLRTHSGLKLNKYFFYLFYPPLQRILYFSFLFCIYNIG